jgi:hypothetical protein
MQRTNKAESPELREALAEIGRLKHILISERISNSKVIKVLTHRVDDLEQLNEDLKSAIFQNLKMYPQPLEKN